MPITQKDVSRIAKLAHIELTKAETQKFEQELSSILTFIEELNAVDTSSVEPVSGGTASENITRADAQLSDDLEETAPELLASTPIQERGYVQVKRIL